MIRNVSLLSMPAILVCSLWMAPALSGQIPKSAGRTLDGTEVKIPDLFKQHPVALVLGFSEKSSEETQTWSRKLIEAEKADGRNDDVYGIILLSRVPRLLRGLVTRSIRKDVSAANQSRFVALTDDDQVWRDLTHYSSSDDAYILVLNAGGIVCWRGHGAYSDQMMASVRDALKQARIEAR